MTNKTHIPIDGFEQITGTSEGHVKSTWSANAGWSRKQEIEKARLEAQEEARKEAEAQLPLNMRFAALESEVMRLKDKVKELEDAKKQ